MPRPASIRRFEVSYLASVLLGAINEALNWKITNSPQAQAALGKGFMPVFLVFVYTLSLLLWWFTARGASGFARWVVVALFVLSALGQAAALGMGNLPSGISGTLRVGAFVLNGVAVWFLFRPDARAWFGNVV